MGTHSRRLRDEPKLIISVTENFEPQRDNERIDRELPRFVKFMMVAHCPSFTHWRTDMELPRVANPIADNESPPCVLEMRLNLEPNKQALRREILDPYTAKLNILTLCDLPPVSTPKRRKERIERDEPRFCQPTTDRLQIPSPPNRLSEFAETLEPRRRKDLTDNELPMLMKENAENTELSRAALRKLIEDPTAMLSMSESLHSAVVQP